MFSRLIYKRIKFAACWLIAAFMATSCVAQALKDENMLSTLPQGFVVGHQERSAHANIMELVPAGETVETWTQMITLQTFYGLGGVSPDTFASGLGNRWKEVCTSGEAAKVRDDVERGYPISIWVFTCPTNPRTNKPENMFLKAIQGQDSLYIVQYAFRSELKNEMALPAMTYFRKIMVCDTRRADRLCPPGM